MLTLLEPVEQVLDAEVAALTFDLTYEVDEQGNGTIQIPVTIRSAGSSFAVRCPPVAVPIGTWTLNWNFMLDPTTMPAVSVSFSLLPNIQGFISVKTQPPTQPVKVSQPTTLTALVTNEQAIPSKGDPSVLPPAFPQPINVVGYYIRVDPASGSSQTPALYTSSMALVQDQTLAQAPGPASFSVTYPIDPDPKSATNNVLQIPVVVSLSADKTSFVVQAPPAALPIGNWTIVWNFSSIDDAVELSQFVDVPNYFIVTSQPATLTNLSQYRVSGRNIMEVPLSVRTPVLGTPSSFSQMITAFGYYIQVKDGAQGRTPRIPTASYDPSIAVVQDPIVG